MTMGRPKAKIPRTKHLNFLVTESEYQKISNIAEKLKISKTETIIRGIELLEKNKPKIYRSQVQDKIPKKSKKNLPVIPSDDNNEIF